MGEEWKPISGFEGLYSISNKGRLKSYKVYPEGKVMKLTNKTGDYLRVVLQGRGKERKSISVHRLVAAHFIPNPSDFPVVNHLDGNRQNNDVSNLEWCTPSQNMRHAVERNPKMTSEMIRYNQHIRPKPVLQVDKKGNVISRFNSATEASKVTGVCQRNILQVANKTPYNPKGQTRKTAGGYIWRFESEVKTSEL